MKQIRWYDKNPDLKEVFEFIQSLSKEYQARIAKDILQILMCEFNLDLDEKINKIASDYNYECKRWYDEDINLFSSFEIIKSLSEVMQREVINRIIKTILFIYLEEGHSV